MTIANTKVLAKVVAGFAVAALALSAFAISAQAQTTTTTTTTTSASSCASFNRDLTVGASGADVTALQQWLISKGFTIAAGATGYFGGQTQAALARYQASVGISPAAGYFGPITRAKVNSVACSGGNNGGDDSDDDDDDSDDDSDDSDDMGDLEGGAGDLESAEYVSDLNNEDVGEGDEEVEVAGLELEADGSDLGFTATRVTLRQTDAAGSEDLDDYADSLMVMFDGEELDSVDVDDIDDDQDDDGFTAYTHTFSFDWEDAIVREGDTGELTLAVNAQDNIDSDDMDNNNWEVFFETVRYTDAQGAVVTEDSLDDIGDSDDQDGRDFSFTTFADANDVELTVDESDENPDEGTTEVDQDGDEEVTILVGELEAEGADISIQEITAQIISTGSELDLDNDDDIEVGEGENTEDVASEYCLFIDGDEVDCVDSDETNGNSTSDDETYTFDADDYVVGADETVEFSIVATLNEIEEGEVVILEARVDSQDIEAETEDDGEELENADKDGSANGEPQTFRSEGLAVDFDDDASDADADNNVGEYNFVLNLEAFGEDVELDENDFNYTVTRTQGGVTTTLGVNGASTDATVTISEDLDCGDFDDDNNVCEVDEGDEGEVIFTVFIQIGDSTDAGVYEVTLDDVNGTNVDEELSTFIGFEG